MKSFIELLNDLKDLTPEKANALVRRVEKILTYEPRVGVFGKTGTGKSSLCNALFGAEIAEISDVAACTRNPQEILVQVGAAGIKLIDCPGVGESQKRDEEYRQLYEKLLPELDLILWLVKADDRALSCDQEFFTEVVSPNLNGKPFFLVLSQVDKIEPLRNWNDDKHVPGEKQQQNIEAKIANLADFFDVPKTQVVPVSAAEKYNLVSLVNTIVFALPKDRKITFTKAVKEEVRSEEAKTEAEKGFFEEIGEVIGEIFGEKQVGKVVGKAVDKSKVGKVVAEVKKFFENFFRSWW
jgi:small GTP-binding protein